MKLLLRAENKQKYIMSFLPCVQSAKKKSYTQVSHLLIKDVCVLSYLSSQLYYVLTLSKSRPIGRLPFILFNPITCPEKKSLTIPGVSESSVFERFPPMVFFIYFFLSKEGGTVHVITASEKCS